MSGLKSLIIENGLIQIIGDRRLEIQKLNFGPLVVIPVSSNTVNITGSLHFLNNTGAGIQDIDNLLGGVESDFLILAGDGIRLRSNGNMSLPNSFVLSTGNVIMLLFVGANWFQLART